ncbi:hypothetical protein LCGC14_2583040 [marine sediment metagenome]|uniref:Uncharacterized protein n=1 Tax=marine sediment metagenome TaxID=412755 RepID=A0A0F9B1W0_9ZZZZ
MAQTEEKTDPLEAITVDGNEVLMRRVQEAAKVAEAASTGASNEYKEIAKQVIFAEVFNGDHELLVMRMLHEKMQPLNPKERQRVFSWLIDRFGLRG